MNMGMPLETELAPLALPAATRFRTLKWLGGAMYGHVWLCEDMAQGGQLVAVKQTSLGTARRLLTANPRRDNPFIERRTVRVLQHLDPHPNILEYYDDVLQDGVWSLTMEYCEGGDLMQRLQATPGGRLSEAQAWPLFKQIVHAVQYLHVHGIAHRDVSLENVLLHRGVCKLADYALSCAADRICTEGVGKAYYMAPEVFAEQPYDPCAADVWSLGILLFVLLTGSPLVQLATPTDCGFTALQLLGVKQILRRWGFGGMVSSRTVEVLEELLQLDPAKRPTMHTLAQYVDMD